MTSADLPDRYVVHDYGDRTLDGIFQLIALAGQRRSLDEVLRATCAHVAASAAADVVSVYVREVDDEGGAFYTLRGNVGFPAEAVGRVSLRAGEGIVGFVAACLRPVSVTEAQHDEHFKYIPGLGEERFPALLAVPVLRDGTAAGVLVLQRRPPGDFTREEIVLATALAAVINHALERAQEHERALGTGRAVARLHGTPLSAGAAMGRVAFFPTLASLARAEVGTAADNVMSCEQAVARVLQEIRSGAAAARGLATPQVAELTLVLEDGRFRKALVAAAAGPGRVQALQELARRYARVPFQNTALDDDTRALMTERASEIEDLCVLVHALMNGRSLVRPGAVVVTERLGTCLSLTAVARGASAFVVDGDLDADGLVARIARGAGLPLLASVTGVFSWVRGGDLMVVDGDSGTVRLNPQATQVAHFRQRRG